MGLPAIAVTVTLALVLAGCTKEETPPDATPNATGSDSGPGTTINASSSSSSSSSSTTPSPRPAQTVDVAIQGNQFVDGSPTIQRGDTVRWTQRDTATHTVTADDGSFDSGNLIANVPTRDQFSQTFDQVGEVPYHCEVHPGMTGTITVAASLPP